MSEASSLVMTAGFAEFPKDTTLHEVYRMIGCVMIVDKETEIIHDISFTFVMDISNQFLAGLLRGASVQNGLDEVKRRLKGSIQVPGQGAILYAIQQAYDRYCELK